MYSVLIISFANWDSLMELPVVFKNAGCTVDVFSTKGSWVLNSSFYDKWIPASEDADKYLKELLNFINTNGDKYNWIIPGDDIILRLINPLIFSEELFCKVMPLTKIENRELLGSKVSFSQLCAKYNIETPRFLEYDKSQTVESIGKFMGFPLMMKIDQSEAGSGVFKCNNQTELKENLEKAATQQKIIFQQFVEGYDINMEILYKNGELIVYSYAKITKILGKFGLSTQRLFCKNEEIMPELVKIGRSFGINGFASVAFMYDERERKHYLIEVDVRPNSWIYYGKFTGNDFSEGIKRIINNDFTRVVPDEKLFPAEIKVAHYKKDVARAIVEKDIKGLLYWLLNKDECRRFIPTYDRKLLRACNRYLWKFFIDLCVNKVKKILGIVKENRVA